MKYNANTLPKIAVLLSSYNGENFIKEQIDSILCQEDVNVQIIVRDDGSSDNTLDIISTYPDILLVKGKNLGCEESFMELLHFNYDAEFFAFSDQDDIWHPRKLITAINNIKSHNCELSACNLQLVNAMGNNLGMLFTDDQISDSMKQMNKYILPNKHGCVLVWTRKLHKLIQSYRPKYSVPHDVWVNSIANIVSFTYVDNESFIQYRQHGNNTAGYALNFRQRLRKGIKHHLGSNHPNRDLIAQSLLYGYGHFFKVNDERKKMLEIISTYKSSFSSRFNLFFHDFIAEDDFYHKVLWRIAILLNRF